MNVYIDFNKIDQCFAAALKNGRDSLFEYETYALLKHSGAESVPDTRLLKIGIRPSDNELTAISGDKVVMKIVSPAIVHKTDVGGVKIIDNKPDKIRSVWRKMMDQVPASYAQWLRRNNDLHVPERYKGLTDREQISAITADIEGCLLCQYMPPDSEAFGSELIVSIRRTREFGMIITAGLGGTDTELYAQHFKKGMAVVTASTALTDGITFFKLFQKTIAYQKLAGISRGQDRTISDDQLIECFSSFIAMANYYSPQNPNAPVVIEELEINPFAFTDYRMVPLDGFCRFSKPDATMPPVRPKGKIEKLIYPDSIVIMGVSGNRDNFGRIILKNLLSCGFDRSRISVIHPKADVIDGAACVGSLAELNQKQDLFILAVHSDKIPDLVGQIIDADLAASVMLISGGLGEKKGSEQKATAMKKKIREARLNQEECPVILGGNCMGVFSRPGMIDTTFVPKTRLASRFPDNPSRTAFISQSGAFMITRISKLPHLKPDILISLGNQLDLSAGDILSFLADSDEIDIIAIYMEGFNELDGLMFSSAVRQAVLNGKEVILYKAGRTPEGKNATSGHTASIAGDYVVCEACVQQAGAIIADSFNEFEDLYVLSAMLNKKPISGNRMAGVSGAGFEVVGMADNVRGEGYALQLASLSPESVHKMADILDSQGLAALVDIKNPIDINPTGDDLLHARITDVLVNDPNVDAVVLGIVPLSPVLQTLPVETGENGPVFSETSIAALLPEIIAKNKKPIVGVVDSGKLYDPLADWLEKYGLPVFRSSDRAVACLAKYISGRLAADQLRRNHQVASMAN